MEVHIDEVASTVRAVDGDALLAPHTLRKILHAVMQAIDEREQHRGRVRAETRISRGVSHEQAETE
jgi:hypothetical protein